MSFSWNDRADELAQECVAKKTSSTWSHLASYCLRMGFFSKLTVHASKIVCAELNRDGYGVNGSDTHEVLEDIFFSGWTDKFFDGLLTDILPEERESLLRFNEDLVSSSQGKLAPIDRDVVKYQTYAGSHTNQGHRQLYISECLYCVCACVGVCGCASALVSLRCCVFACMV